MKTKHLQWKFACLSLAACLSACGGATKPPAKEAVRPAEPAPVKPVPEAPQMAVHTCWTSTAPVEPGRTRRVEIRGFRAPALLCERFPVRPGDPLEAATTDANIRALFGEGRVEDVVVYKEEQKDGVVAVYELKIRRRVRTVKVRSVADIDQSVANELVTEAPSWEDNARFDEMVRAATVTLAARGYRRANITLETTPEGDEEINVALVVEPGVRTTVGTFDVEGFSPARWTEISSLLGTKVGEPFSQDMLERDVLVMTADLFDRGMVSAEFANPEIVETPDGSKVNIKLRVKEGPVFKVRQVKFVGDLVGNSAIYFRDAWRTKTGAVFSRKAVVEDVDNVKRLHVSKGSPADIDIETNLDPKSSTVDLVVRIKRKP